MTGVPGAYGALIRAGFRRHAAYPLAAAAGAFANIVFGLLRASVLTATATAAGGIVAGYDVAGAATYAFVTQALIAPVNVFSWSDLGDRIRTGDVAVDLARPVDLQLQYLFMDLGRALYALLPRGLPPLVAGAVAFGLALPGAVWPYLVGLLSVGLAVLISFGCRYLVNLAAFWLLDIRGPMTLYVVIMNVLGGLTLPVPLFPGWLAVIARATPFPSMIQTPADLLTGRVTGVAALGLLLAQGGWLVAVLATGRLVQVAATRKLVIQGG